MQRVAYLFWRNAFPAFNDGFFLIFGANPRTPIQKSQKVKYVNNDGRFVGHFPPWDLRKGGEMLKGRLKRSMTSELPAR
jgi:hypothetical protein